MDDATAVNAESKNPPKCVLWTDIALQQGVEIIGGRRVAIDHKEKCWLTVGQVLS